MSENLKPSPSLVASGQDTMGNMDGSEPHTEDQGPRAQAETTETECTLETGATETIVDIQPVTGYQSPTLAADSLARTNILTDVPMISQDVLNQSNSHIPMKDSRPASQTAMDIDETAVETDEKDAEPQSASNTASIHEHLTGTIAPDESVHPPLTHEHLSETIAPDKVEQPPLAHEHLSETNARDKVEQPPLTHKHLSETTAPDKVEQNETEQSIAQHSERSKSGLPEITVKTVPENNSATNQESETKASPQLSEDTLKELQEKGMLHLVQPTKDRANWPLKRPAYISSDSDEDETPCTKKPLLGVKIPAKTPAVKTSLQNDLDLAQPPKLIGESFTEFDKRLHKGNFLKGCKWSPNGCMLLTNSNDNQPRVFHTPSTLTEGYVHDIPDLEVRRFGAAGGVIYDFEWHPRITDSQQFVYTSRDSPVHLFDASTAELRASYRAYDQNDELTSAHSLAFSLDGKKLYTGYNKTIRVFDVERPGRDFTTRKTFNKQGQPGIISCIAINPSMPTIYAAGSYSRVVALYTEPKGSMMCMFEGQAGGVTHLMFSPDGSKLYTGGRKDPEILCWDMRKPGQILFTVHRKVHTNQRMYFDLDSSGRYLVSGMHDGSMRVWDTLAAPTAAAGTGAEPMLPPVLDSALHMDTLNGISFHPTLPVLATTSGQRHFPIPSGLESSDDDDGEADRDNSVRLWWCGKWAQENVSGMNQGAD